MNSNLLADIEQLLSSAKVGDFAIVDFVPEGREGNGPYVQAAHEPSGWYLEVVSDRFLPRSDWPINELALRRCGWTPPADVDDNWSRFEEGEEDVRALAVLMHEGLVAGRVCVGAGSFRLTVGTFPPGPDGGLPLRGHRLALVA